MYVYVCVCMDMYVHVCVCICVYHIAYMQYIHIHTHINPALNPALNLALNPALKPLREVYICVCIFKNFIAPSRPSRSDQAVNAHTTMAPAPPLSHQGGGA